MFLEFLDIFPLSNQKTMKEIEGSRNSNEGRISKGDSEECRQGAAGGEIKKMSAIRANKKQRQQ